MFTKCIVFGMRANPFYKEVGIDIGKIIFADQPVIISTNIEHHPVTSVTQQIGSAKCVNYICRRAPIGIF